MINKKTLITLEYDKILHELAKMAQTAAGRQRCEDLLPVDNPDEIRQLQLETDHAVRVIFERGVLPLGGISDISASVRRAETGSILSAPELLRISAFLRAVAKVKSQIPQDNNVQTEDDYPWLVYDRVKQLVALRPLLMRLEECIAGEDEIHDRATNELYNIRRRIKETQQDVKDHLARIIRSHAHSLQDQLVTLRSDRYVVPVKADHRGDIQGIVHDTSSSGATLFIEPIAVVELNNKIRELISQERDEIERILQELSALTAADADTLLSDFRVLTELDFMMAKARLALKMKAMPPIINTENRVRLKAARHPLIPADRVVPIDVELGIDFHTLVITGPNTGGKTVTLKTVGLFTLMAMSGLQIPARERSEVAVFSQVLADIGDEQSIEQDLSTFSSHLKQLKQITEQARPGTLVLVDELGSGTDPSEGAALAIAILDHLHMRGCVTVATTHYKELKGYAIHTPDVENACCEFDTETLRPTYRLLIGVPGVSNAFAISSRLGLMPEIIEQARSLISEEGMRFEDLVQSMEQSRSEADRLKMESEKLHREAEDLRDQLEQEKKNLRDKKKEIIQKAREEARSLYQEAEDDIQNQIQDLKQKMKKQDARQQHHLSTQTRQQLRSGRGRIEQEIGAATLSAVRGKPLPAELIREGETYFAPSLGINGKLVEGPDSKGQCVLQQGSLRVRVDAASLRLPDGDADMNMTSFDGQASSPAAKIANRAARRRERSSGGDSVSMSTKLNQTTEIKLLGQTSLDAVSNLDQFMDQAVLSGLHQIRVVHGKGTGALRTAVHQMLKRDSRVAGFRLAAFGEGDSGVTIVDLK